MTTHVRRLEGFTLADTPFFDLRVLLTAFTRVRPNLLKLGQAVGFLTFLSTQPRDLRPAPPNVRAGLFAKTVRPIKQPKPLLILHRPAGERACEISHPYYYRTRPTNPQAVIGPARIPMIRFDFTFGLELTTAAALPVTPKRCSGRLPRDA